MKQTTTIATKAGNFEVMEHNGKAIVCKNGKALATLTGVHPHDKDTIIAAIENNAEELKELSEKSTKDTITPENIVPALSQIYDILNSSIEDKQTKGFVASRLKQVINKLAAA